MIKIYKINPQTIPQICDGEIPEKLNLYPSSLEIIFLHKYNWVVHNSATMR